MAFVNIVTSDRGWILDNLARQITDRLPYVRFGNGIDLNSDIQYYVTYSCRYRKIAPLEVAYFAHLEPEGEARDNFFQVAAEVDYCICHAQLYANMLQDAGVQNVAAISPGVDTDHFAPRIRIGVVGRTYHTGRKGEHLVAQMMDIPEIEWRFTGSGWPQAGLHLPDSAMPDFYRKLDYVLVPALYEGGPMCVVEALASGTEVIAPEIGWAAEFPHIEYKVGDVEDLRRVLLALVEKKRALRDTVRTRTWDAWAEGHDRVFQFLAASRGLTLSPPSPKASGASFRSVGLYMHGDEGKSPGGPSVRVPRLARELREWGVEAAVAQHPGDDFQAYDIVHAFNVWSPRTALDLISRAKAADRKVVFSPIFLDLTTRPLWHDRLPQIFAEAANESDLLGQLDAFHDAFAETRVQTEAPAEPVPGFYASVRTMLAQSNRVILLSERERARLERIGCDVSHGTIVRNPVDWQLFSNADPEVFKTEFGLSDFVLCVARQESRKNQLMLIQALKGLNIPIVLVGHTASQQYRKLLGQHSDTNVTFIERLPPNSPMLASAFAASRVSVLVSWAEGAPLAALEAAAAGASMVLSDESGEREYFGDWATYCDPSSIADMRRAILERYESPRSRDLAESQKSYIATTYNWARHRDATLEVYRDLYRGAGLEPAVANAKAAESPAPRHGVDIVFDVTTSANHNGRWTGIARVEAALAQALNDNPNVRSICFVAWNNRAESFISIPYEAIKAGKTKSILSHYDNKAVAPFDLPRGAYYIVGGSGWMQNSAYAEALVMFKRAHRLKLTPIIHDLIPVRFPFWFNDGYAQVFINNLNILLGNSDYVLAVSENTRRDIVSFANSIVGMRLPAIGTFREGDEIQQVISARKDEAPHPALANKPFVLCVGAIHQRKNHKLLYDVWVKLAERMGGRCPALVIVGGVAWNGHDTAKAMEGDARVKHKIHILDDVDDGALEWLYRNCIFTVYPSLYEGWGLPVAESLRYGKLCLASNAASVPEIAPGFVDLLDPVDPVLWAARIQFFAGSRLARESREHHIAEDYRGFTWRDSANQMIEALLHGDSESAPPATYAPGTISSLANRFDGARHKVRGWNLTEKWGCWSSARHAELEFRPCEAFDGAAVFVAEIRTLTADPQDVRVYANGALLTTWTLTGSDLAVHAAVLPKLRLDRSEPVVICIESDRVVQVSRVMKSEDRRIVGVGVGRFFLAHVETVGELSRHLVAAGRPLRGVHIGKCYDVFRDAPSRSLLQGDRKFDSGWGAFSIDMQSRINLSVLDAIDQPLEVDVFLRPVATPADPMTILVLVNDHQTCAWTFHDNDVHRLTIPISAAARRLRDPVSIDLVPSDVWSPKAIGIDATEQAFGFGLFTIRVRRQSDEFSWPELHAEVGQRLFFDADALEAKFRMRALPGPWHNAEKRGIWAAGQYGVVGLRFASHKSSRLRLTASVGALAGAERPADVEMWINGALQGRAQIPNGVFVDMEAVFESSLLGPRRAAVVEFRAPGATTPLRIGAGQDLRMLGVRLSSILVESLNGLVAGELIRFDLANQAQSQPYLDEHWYDAEEAGRWCQGDQGRIVLRPITTSGNERLFFVVRAVVAANYGPTTVDVEVNGVVVDEWRFWDEEATVAEVCNIGHFLGFDEDVAIRFRLRVPLSPEEMGANSDSRRLGLQLGAMLATNGDDAEAEALSAFVAAGFPFTRSIDRNPIPERLSDAIPVAVERIDQVAEIIEALRREGEVFDLSDEGDPASVLDAQWYPPEAGGSWCKAWGGMVLPSSAGAGAPARVSLLLRVFGAAKTGPAYVVAHLASGRSFLLEALDDHHVRADLPVESGDISESGAIRVTLHRLGAVAPAALGEGDDTRILGVFVRAAVVCNLPEEARGPGTMEPDGGDVALQPAEVASTAAEGRDEPLPAFSAAHDVDVPAC